MNDKHTLINGPGFKAEKKQFLSSGPTIALVDIQYTVNDRGNN